MRAPKHRPAASAVTIVSLAALSGALACSVEGRSAALLETSAPSAEAAAAPSTPPTVIPAAAESEPAEQPSAELLRRRLDGYVDEGLCATLKTGDPLGQLAEPEGPRRKFSIHGYVARMLRIEREVEGALRRHCISVSWPAGDTSTDGAPVSVAAHIDDGWFRGLENTFQRVPWHHVLSLWRIVIDNRPKEHGIAPFDHGVPDDARDGHTMWLHEQLFRDPNHWSRGNFGGYWSYHVDQDKKRFDDQPADHALFSPVLLHELGHLVSYNVLNGNAADPSVPRCARMCGDRDGCDDLEPAEREAGCISPYCMPFTLATGTENWAEQYRFYYQSKKTRALVRAAGSCHRVLAAQDGGKGKAVHPPPWEAGLPDIARFQRSVWDSCDNRQCKPF